MKKILLIFLTSLLSQSMLAMELTQKAQSQKEQVELDAKFVDMLLKFETGEAEESEIKEFIERGANPNAKNTWGPNALMSCIHSPALVQCLIAAGANLYYGDPYHRRTTALIIAARDEERKTIQLILDALSQLSGLNKYAIKNWLLLSKRLEEEQQIKFPKDILKCITQHIVLLFAREIQRNVVHAGGDRVMTFNMMLGAHIRKYADVQFLTKLVWQQMLLPQSMK